MTSDSAARPARSEAPDLVDRLGALYTAVVADCLDGLGARRQVMGSQIRPLDPAMRLAGRAVTLELAFVDAPPADPRDNYRKELEAVAALEPADVLVASTCHGSFWGELLATASRARGAHGVIADAYTRDTSMLVEMGFPTFVAGVNAEDSLGRLEVTAIGIPISCAGVRVHTGDLVLADRDGVVVLPSALAAQAIEAAENKVSREDGMRDALAAGMPVTEAFRRFKVL